MTVSSHVFCDGPNYVVDFETLGTSAKAFVLSGALASWWSTGLVQLEGYWRFELNNQPGREIHPNTVEFWMNVALTNPEAARDAFQTQPRVSLQDFRKDLAKILFRGPYTMMAKPQDFDLPILEDIFRMGLTSDSAPLVPFKGRHNCRTLWAAAQVFDPNFQEVKPIVEHRADYDALALAATCSKAFQILQEAQRA